MILLVPLGCSLITMSSQPILSLFPISQLAPYLVWLWPTFLHLWAASNTFWISSHEMYAEFTPAAEMSSWNQDAFEYVVYYLLRCISYSNLCCSLNLSIDFFFHILLWSCQAHFSSCSWPKSDCSSVPFRPPFYSLYDQSSNTLQARHCWTLVCLPASECCSIWGFYSTCSLMFHSDEWLCPFDSYLQQTTTMAGWTTLSHTQLSWDETYPSNSCSSLCRCLAVSSHQQATWQNMDPPLSYPRSNWFPSSSCICSFCHTFQNQMAHPVKLCLLSSESPMTWVICFGDVLISCWRYYE